MVSRYMNRNSTKLAIVIPAFKGKYLNETLNSIADQTSRQFNLYICDDHSPDPLRDIAKKFEGRLAFSYNRFENNLGNTSLVKQWERCIDVTSEEWVWLFSDDDIMEPRCVEEFYNCLEESPKKFDIYRFNTLIINDEGKIIGINPLHPKEEDCLQFLYFFLRGLRASVMQDHIFSRSAYRRCGGFKDFPLGWCSDQAIVLRIGAEKGYQTMPHANVRFRQGGINISSSKQKSLNSAKVEAATLFIDWLFQFIQDQKVENFAVSKSEMMMLAQNWLTRHLIALHGYLSLSQMTDIAKFLSKNRKEPLWINLMRMLKVNCSNFINDLRKFVRNEIRN
jgi:glycosyltransferase involved in cell wall biosynthesis